MKKELAAQWKQKCSCCGRAQARMRWQGFRLCPTCRIDITRDETLKNTMLGLEAGASGKKTGKVRYQSCPSCQRRITKQYGFYCSHCRTRICIYCTAPDGENLCMPCSDKLRSPSTILSAAEGSETLMFYQPDLKAASQRLSGAFNRSVAHVKKERYGSKG